MAWNKVEVKIDGEIVNGMLQLGTDILVLTNLYKLGDTINVNGKDRKIISSVEDFRDNIVHIKLAGASKPKPKEKKSDDKQAKG